MKRLGWIGVLALTLGCPSDDSGAGGGDTETDGDMGTTAASATISTSADPATMTSASASMTSAGTTGPDPTGMESGSFINPGTSPDDTGEPGPLGAMCGTNDDCVSGFCYMVPMLGGVCSECLTDDDCEFGCGVDLGLGYAVCTDGSVGSMCGTEEACTDGLLCAELIDTGGLFPLNFCSECATNADCRDGDLCTPIYDVMNIGGYLGCAAPGSVGDGEGCPYAEGVGDGTVCENGHCGGADLFGFITLGLCGNCSIDDDCLAGETCMPASIGMDGAVGPTCG